MKTQSDTPALLCVAMCFRIKFNNQCIMYGLVKISALFRTHQLYPEQIIQWIDTACTLSCGRNTTQKIQMDQFNLRCKFKL